MRPHWIALVFLMGSGAQADTASELFERGTAAFESHRYDEALESFLDVLKVDASNTAAHQYVQAIGKAMLVDRRAAVQKERLAMLENIAHHMEPTTAQAASYRLAIDETTNDQVRAHDTRWQARCDEARLQAQSGHLLSAFDLVFRVLRENGSFAEAQRLLTVLQSQTRSTLDHASDLPSPVRYALEGFYAYSQADYAAASAAWHKAQVVALNAFSTDALHFDPYLSDADEHVATDQRLAARKTLFERGQRLYDQKQYGESLQILRELAMQDPDFPHLAQALVRAESAVEQQRAQHMSEARRAEVAELVRQAARLLEKEQYADVEPLLARVLKIDPSNPQARSYLTLARAELSRRTDPQAAETHYQTGILDYAGGRIEDAVREFRLALRMNPKHERAIVALAKTQRQLAYDRETP